MDISFALQALTAEHIVKHYGELEPHVYPVSQEIDRRVAELALAELGLEIDSLSEAQRGYLASWE